MVTSRSTSTARSTTWTAARPEAAARVSSQARWRHEDEHHFGIRPRAGSRIVDPHQPHARVCPGRRGDRDPRSSVVALLSVFMHVPPLVCFVPTTLATGGMADSIVASSGVGHRLINVPRESNPRGLISYLLW